MYDDGLARFSVFLEPLNGATVTDTRTQLGPTVAVSRRLTTPEGEIMVTVVGEVSPSAGGVVTVSGISAGIETSTVPSPLSVKINCDRVISLFTPSCSVATLRPVTVTLAPVSSTLALVRV